MMKQKILADAKKRIRQKREKHKRFFAQKYDKTKTFKFPPKDKINMEKHFYFPKFIGHFQTISKAALAVYPVICSRANFDNNTWIQLPQEHIAKMAGVSVNTAATVFFPTSRTRWSNTPATYKKSRFGIFQ